MNLALECGRSCLRAAGIAGAVGALASWLQPAVQASSRGRRGLRWALLALPFLTPALVVGYAYSSISLTLLRQGWLKEALYDLLLLMKLTPVGVLLVYLTPRRMSPAAVHCQRLGDCRRHATARLMRSWRFAFQSRRDAWIASFGVVFLLAFNELEMASLLYLETWTVRIFDAQAGGLPLLTTLRLTAAPVAGEFLLLALLASVLLRAAARARPAAGSGASNRSARVLYGRWSYILLALVVVTLIPAAIMLRGTADGLAAVFRNGLLFKDIMASVFFAIAGTVCCALCLHPVADFATGSGRSRNRLLSYATALAAPGLLGALVLALVVLAVFTTPGARRLYDTPLPLLVCLTLLLAPPALMLHAALGGLRSSAANHTAKLLGSSPVSGVRTAATEIRRTLTRHGRHWIYALLFFLAYHDLTASAILAPSGMTPVPVRLYNLMHYGRTQILSAMVCLAFAVPLLVIGMFAIARRLTPRREGARNA